MCISCVQSVLATATPTTTTQQTTSPILLKNNHSRSKAGTLSEVTGLQAVAVTHPHCGTPIQFFFLSASFLTVHLHAAAGVEGRGPSEESRRRGCSKHRCQLPSSASPDGLHKVKPSITVITIPAHVTVFILFLLITSCGACKAAQPRWSLSCPRLAPNYVQQRLPITAKQTQSATGN